jgi:hypothetical protein
MKSLRRATLLLSFACGPADPECRPGFVLAPDGHCYPPPPDPEPPDLTDVLEASGPCLPRRAGEEIDLALGCIEGVCRSSSYLQARTALGPPTCELTSDEADWLCDWPQGIQTLFPVGEADDAEPSDSAITAWVRGVTHYAGADGAGLGVGVTPRCFVDELGPPSIARFVDVAGELRVQEMIWLAYGVEIEDEEQADGVVLPDNVVDELTLTPP